MVRSLMNIAIFGDSFANFAYSSKINEQIKPWMIWIEEISQYKITSFGQPGTSTWFSYKEFLKYYKNFDIVIFCYSSPDRWFNINNFQNFSHIIFKDKLSTVSPEIKNVLEPLVNSHPYLYDEQFNNFVFQKVFNSINELCKQNNKTIINLLTFENFTATEDKLSIDVSLKFGPVLTALNEISLREINMAKKTNASKSEEYINTIFKHKDFRFCHLNTHNNKILAEIIVENLKEPKPYVNLTKDSRWSFDIKHLESYFN